MQNVTTLVLSDAEIAAVLAARNGNAVAIVDAPVAAPTGFIDRMLALNGTNLNRWAGVRPAAVINTKKGRRGVFWVGYKNGVLRIGTCKITDAGRCYKPNKYDGAWFDDAETLALLNS
jgi:hypothetical protein